MISEEVQGMYLYRIRQFVNAMRKPNFDKRIITTQNDIFDLGKILGKTKEEIQKEIHHELLVAEFLADINTPR